MVDDFVLPPPVLQPRGQPSTTKPKASIPGTETEIGPDGKRRVVRHYDATAPSSERAPAPVATREPATKPAENNSVEQISKLPGVVNDMTAQLAAHGPVLGRGRQIKAMQEQLGNLRGTLSQIFETDNKDLANLMNRYAQGAENKTSFFDHLKHMVGLGRSAAEQADGTWGGKTTQGLTSMAYVAGSIEKLSRDLGSKGQNEIQGVAKELADLINKAKADPANAERLYAPEIGVQLLRLQKSMELVKQQATEASKHLNTALEAKLQQKPRSRELETLILGGNDTGLRVSDPVLKTNMPISFAALKDTQSFKAYLRQLGVLGETDAETDNAHIRTILNGLMQQADQQLQELQPPSKSGI